jgi:hypothetical protein
MEERKGLRGVTPESLEFVTNAYLEKVMEIENDATARSHFKQIIPGIIGTLTYLAQRVNMREQWSEVRRHYIQVHNAIKNYLFLLDGFEDFASKELHSVGGFFPEGPKQPEDYIEYAMQKLRGA